MHDLRLRTSTVLVMAVLLSAPLLANEPDSVFILITPGKIRTEMVLIPEGEFYLRAR